MLPNFVIIGAQKSASTFLQYCLNDHPDVYLPHGETPFFESPDYERSDIRDLEKSLANRCEKRVGIKRPSYIGKPEVPERISFHLPQAKLIAVLRNPIDRAISAYHHNIKYGFLPPIDIQVGMRKLISEPSFLSKYKRSSEIIEFGYYYKYLREYDHFKKNGQLLVFLHEDFLSDPLASVQIAFDFLGVHPDFIPKSLNSKPQKVTYNLTRLKFLSIRNRFMYEYEQDRTRLSPKKMTFMDKAIAGVITKIDQTILESLFGKNGPEVGSELRKIMYDLYDYDIELLEKLIGRNLSAWRPN